jgi:hypothetical protein
MDNLASQRESEQPLFNVILRELPPKYQDLLNPLKPLTVEHFSPRVLTLPYWIFTAFPFTALIIIFVQLFRRPLSLFDLIWFLPLFISSFVALFIAVRMQRKKSRVEGGDLRLGVLIHPDAILIRIKENVCYLFPKSYLKEAIIERFSHGRRIFSTVLTFVGRDAQQFYVIKPFTWISFWLGAFDCDKELEESFRRWKPKMKITRNKS